MLTDEERQASHERRKAKQRQRYHERMADPLYREQHNARLRVSTANDPEGRERYNKRRKLLAKLQRIRMADPDYRQRHNELVAQHRRERYASDPHYREIMLARSKDYRNRPEHHERRRAYAKEWVKNRTDLDPKYTDKRREYMRKWRQSAMENPEYREQQRIKHNEYYRRRWDTDPEWREWRKARNRLDVNNRRLRNMAISDLILDIKKKLGISHLDVRDALRDALLEAEREIQCSTEGST